MTELLTTLESNVIDEIDAPVVFEIPAYNLSEFQSRVEKANNRLAKNDSEARFEFTYEGFQRRKITGNENVGIPVTSLAVYEPWVRATLVSESLTLAIGDYTFVASLVAEEAGYTVHSAPGQNLDGWTRPAVDDIHCDHCNTVRNRTHIYIVRNNVTGELVQLGSTCIPLYLGFSPKSLWALTFTESLSELSEEREGGFSAARDYSAEINTVLATSFAYTNKGKNYVSTSRGGWDGGPTPTVGKVREHIFGGEPRRINFGRDEEGYQKAVAEYRTKVVEIAGFLTDEALIAEIKASVEAVKEGTDYGDNLRVILAAPSGIVGGKNVGILASLVSVYARELQLAEERSRKVPPAAGFIGKVGERIRNFSITLTNVREIDGEWGTTTLLVGTTEDNHVVKWFASGTFDYDLGDVVKLEAATVKAHENYKGTDQTVLTRGKIDTFEERAEACREEIARNNGAEYFETTDYVNGYSDFRAAEQKYYLDKTGDVAKPVYSSEAYPNRQEVRKVYYVDRYFNSKAEIKRFAAWQAAQKEV